MSLVTTPALVLQTYRYSETSKVVRLATRDLGVQSAIAKGALRPKSRFGAGLELLSEGMAQLYFRETRELHTLGAFDLVHLRRDLAADVGRLARALQRGGRGSALPAVRTDLGPAAQPPPAPRVRRSRGPERPASGATAARCLARGRPPPPRRPLRPLPPGRGGPTFGPGLLGASRVGTPHSNSDSLRRFVIGTAGHIDHGKTALVKALTGVDTDRWEEEKRRGITIDLGFAPLPLGGDVQASVVDVPGHEGFVRNMLAGATGIDVALLVIAADEGIMPQTEEHL